MKQPDDGSRRGFLKASSMLGLAVAFGPATPSEAFADSKSRTTEKENAMTQSSATQRGSEQPDSIRPFHVNFPEAELTDLRRRINATRWPDEETVTDDTQGVQFATMQAARALLGDRLRLAQVRGETERPAAVHHRDRRAGHPFHSRPFET